MEPSGEQRLRQASSLQVRLCGAQFNLAADFALLGKSTAFLSRLPDNQLGQLAYHSARRYGVDMSHVLIVPDSRMGLIFVEFGGEPRAATHLYDRQDSAASATSPADFDWPNALSGTRLAYTDGIFAGLSDSCRETALEFIRTAKQQGCLLCFDVNYRQTISTPAEAACACRKILPCVDVLVTNRWVSESIFGFGGTDEDLVRRYYDQFGCGTVCLTSRHMDGARRGSWSSLALHKGDVIRGRTREFDVVDRFGTGDAFFAGFLYGWLERDTAFGLEFGNAMCALAHTIPGDVADISASEVMHLLDGGYDLRIKR